MANFTIKANDTYPPIELTLTDQAGAIDLTTADVVRLLLKSATLSIVTGPVTIVDAVAGKISYTWEADDLLQVGAYRGEVEITWDPGVIETIPNDGYFTVDVLEDLG